MGLVLPLAMPAYVMAYAYTDWLQAAGPVQALLRDLTGWKVREYWFPEIRSLPGAAAMLSFALYPYVYLLARNAFLEQSRTTMEAARLAGYGAWGRFWRVASASGAHRHRCRHRLGAYGGACRLRHGFLFRREYVHCRHLSRLAFARGPGCGRPARHLSADLRAVMLSLSARQRGGARYAAKRTPMPPQPLHGAAGAIAWIMCSVPVTFGFLVPAALLIKLAAADPEARFSARSLRPGHRTLSLWPGSPPSPL